MIQIFETKEKKLVEIDNDFTGGINLFNKWVHLENPTDLEIELLGRVIGVDEDKMKAALDENERSRIEVDEGQTLIVFDVPVIEKEQSYYSYTTVPVGVIITDKTIISVCLKPNSVIKNMINQRVKDLDTSERNRFLYQMLYLTHVKFLQYLKQVDRSYQRIQVELHRSTKNKELIQLLDLENSLVYLSTSLRGNTLVVERLIKQAQRHESEYNIELLEDVQIESRQALDMCNIYRDVLSGTMDAYASVISNNLNITMKFLTVISVIISIPAIVSSFWGMNTGVPFQGQLYGFYIVIVISIVICILAFLFLRQNERLRLSVKKSKRLKSLRQRKNKKEE